MADLPDRRALFQIGRRAINLTPGLRINPKVIDTEGSDVNILLGAMAVMGEETIGGFSQCMKGLFVETSEGDALDRVAYDKFQLTRQSAVPATVDLIIERSGIGAAGTYIAGSRVQTAGGTQFAIDVDAVFDTATLIVTVSATALSAGPESNVPADKVNQFVDQPFSSAMTVRNPRGAAGGADQETDIEFRARILDFFPTIRRGTIGAIEFGGRSVPGVAFARAYEVINVCNGDPFPACLVELVVSDRLGGYSESMLQAVRDQLLNYRPAGIPVRVLGGAVQEEDVIWSLSYEPNIDTRRVRDEVRATSVAVAQFLGPGEILRRSSLIAAARAVPGAIVRDNSLVEPAGDIDPGITGRHLILRVAAENVTFA